LLLLAFFTLHAYLLAQDFKKEVIYQIITDRFYDGDPTNNDPPQSKGMYDPTRTNWQAYWGGDFAGIQAKLPYLHAMGVTALWISPPVDNSNRPWIGPNGKPVPYMFAPYHGYGARDFSRLEEHFGSAKNDWKAFDAMVSAAHKLGIRIIVDFSPNDTNLVDTGEFGAVYDHGKLLGTYDNDTKHLYHHNGPLTDWTDRYAIQYDNVYNLADLDHQNPVVDRYIKQAAQRFQDHGVDAFRIDAVKHLSWGWVYSFADTVRLHKPSFLFAEWFEDGPHDKMYPDSVKFSNNSGIPLLDYPLALATREVFAHHQSFKLIDDTLAEQDRNFAYPNNLVTFVDNHDIPRLLSLNNDSTLLNEATAFVLTARGIPIVYYGDEQYLHNDTNKGVDPYNRPWMSSFDQSTIGFRLVQKLTGLRKSNDALAYGNTTTRSVDADTYVFERSFANSIVLVAINKNATASATLRRLKTALPSGFYPDYLNGLLDGVTLRVGPKQGPSLGDSREDEIASLTLPPHSFSVWQVQRAAQRPAIGSVGPTDGEPGMELTIDGACFGQTRGSVHFDSVAAQVISWTEGRLVVRVPRTHDGHSRILVTDKSGISADPINFTIHQAKLIPVTFTLANAPALQNGDALYMTGSTEELGNWTHTTSLTPGPFLCPHAPACFLDVSVPAGIALEYKYFVLGKTGSIAWQEDHPHAYKVPITGTGSQHVSRQ